MMDVIEIGFALFPVAAAAIALILFQISQPKLKRVRILNARRRSRDDA